MKSVASARRSVVVVNYLATLEEGDKAGPVARIVGALIVAVRRGVRVTVILEGTKFRENWEFYRRLKNGGADVWMDTSETFIHTKAVLIDGRRLCIGSHNLSPSALLRHEEMSAVISGRAVIGRFEKELEEMTLQRREIAQAVCRKGARLPAGVIMGTAAPLAVLKRAVAGQAYLLYLLLCRIDGGTPRHIKVEPDEWVRTLGLPPSMGYPKTRISNLLKAMDKRFRVVEYDEKRGRVQRFSLPSGPSILLPDTFWNFGWHRRISVGAIHYYLAGEAEKLVSPFAPWWRLKRDDIAKRYGFQKQHVNREQTELERAGLLEVMYDMLPVRNGRYIRYMNYFRENPFYDYEARQADIGRIAGRYPPRVFKAAMRLVTLTRSDSNRARIDNLCRLIAAAGPKKAGRVAAKIVRLAPSSTRRTFAYAEELLGSHGGL